jgi:hypothetical protein
MHRSGTSAVTGAVGALGFNTVAVDDRLSTHDSNPEHWESLSILLQNDAILAHFGGTWDAPPRLPTDWETQTGLPDRSTASERLTTAYPDHGPAVWKDPRVCLLLPYWREVLNAPMVAVLVWRNPLAVARSLQRRDDMPLPYGVALWERYNRSAISNLIGTETYVLDYDAMIDNPASSLSGLTAWLGSMDIFEGMPSLDVDSALSAVTTSLRHETVTAGDDERIVLDEQRRLVEHLNELAGGHRSLPQLSGGESPWTEAIIDARGAMNVLEMRKLERRLEHSDAERDWFASALEDARADVARLKAEADEMAASAGSQEDARAQLIRLKASSSWRITAPARSVGARWAARRDRRVEGHT